VAKINEEKELDDRGIYDIARGARGSLGFIVVLRPYLL